MRASCTLRPFVCLSRASVSTCTERSYCLLRADANKANTVGARPPRVAGRASPGQTGIAARRVSSANTPGNRLSHLVSSSDSRVSTHSVHEGLCIFAVLERTEGSTGANLQRHVFRSRALMTCTLARPQRRARFVLSETFYVPPGQDPCHLVRQLQHEQLQNHSYSVLYQQAPARLQATPRRQKQHTLLISQPVQRRLI